MSEVLELLHTRMIFTLVIAGLLAGHASAQTTMLSGTVVDQSSAAVSGATVILEGSGIRESTVSGARGEYAFQVARSGVYQVTVTRAGFAATTQDEVRVGAASVQLAPIVLRIASLTDTVIVSATRSDTPLIDVPAAVSVVDQSFLASTSARSVPDVLRMIPGVNVIQLSARDLNVTTRGTPSATADSLFVIVDDRPIYENFFGLVLWDFLPTDIADIKQMEVIRGPASAVWGGNSLTGVLDIITKSPREAPRTTVSMSAGAFSRDAGSTAGAGPGGVFSANATVTQAPSAMWSYRLSAGYFGSSSFPRPVGQIPIIANPSDPSTVVGGGLYPIDGDGPLGSAYRNTGTSQPKFEARVDQEISEGRVTYGAGIGGSSGVIYTGIGPFDLQRGSYTGYAKVDYRKRGLKFDVFTNVTNTHAPNLLLPDPSTGEPLKLNLSTQTYGAEIGDVVRLASRHTLSFGVGIRRNNASVSLGPDSHDQNDEAAYIQDEIVLDRLRLTAGVRFDKFGNQDDLLVSPRFVGVLKMASNQSLRLSFNHGYRAPAPAFNYLNIPVVSPTDLSAIAPLLPESLQGLVSQPFPLVVHIVGSQLPVGDAQRAMLVAQSLTAYEFGYTGTFKNKTTIGASLYVNEVNNGVSLASLPSTLDPYTATTPPPGLPSAVMTVLAENGISLPRTAFTYANGGSRRDKGLELSVEHVVTPTLTGFANYSWQARPVLAGDRNIISTTEPTLPPMNRFNAGINLNGSRFLGSASVNVVNEAFWNDVLLDAYAGFTDAYASVNGAFGIKWAHGRITTLVRGTNLTNQDIQQHVFGDIIKRLVVAELRLTY